MVKSVLQKPLSMSNVSRNAFDVGYSNKFTASIGMLLPWRCPRESDLFYAL